MKIYPNKYSRSAKHIKYFSFTIALLFFTVIMNSCDKETVDDVLTGLSEMTSYKVAYAESAGSGYDIKLAEIEDTQLKSTSTLVSSTNSLMFDLSDDGKFFAHVTDNSVDVYNTSTGSQIESYSAEFWSNVLDSDIAEMLREATGKSSYALRDVLDVDWSSQDPDILGIHCQITIYPNGEAVGATGIAVDIGSDDGKYELKPLAGSRSQDKFHSFDWSPSDASVVFSQNVSAKTVYWGDVSQSSSGNFSGENPEWGKTGIAYLDNGDAEVYLNGNITNITSLSGAVKDVDMSAAGNNNKNDMISWLYNGNVYFAVSDGNNMLPTNSPYTNSNNGFEVPINASIAAFDIATQRYAP